MSWIIYGAYGYTGKLIAEEAARRKLRPILAGRDASKVDSLAQRLELEARTFSLDDYHAIVGQLQQCDIILNCAGPFSKTAAPLMEACLAAQTHYLDITGELDVIEAAAALDDRAKEAGVILMPAVGFDVVPTDCLAAMLKEKLPSATQLQLALAALTQVSRGTSRTMAEMLPAGGRVRRDGEIIRVPLAHKSQSVAFADRRRQTVTMPWGDVSSAYYSTGIENIEVYFALPKWQIKWLMRLRGLLPLMGLWPISALLKSLATPRETGPSVESRSQSRAQLWGKVSDEAGCEVAATMTTPNGYSLTVDTALAAVERILWNKSPDLFEKVQRTDKSGDLFHDLGFQTPSGAFGSEFVLQFDVAMQWVDSDDS